ncbi:MAG: hypothetical protein FWC16_02615 [Defluviitaleaceae bacterium]|nr:hypothetical protein [Defluviitaleaceae bacterium]MCL2273792.1 hypothetical protein [Defluviitaleaceae bacterium]
MTKTQQIIDTFLDVVKTHYADDVEIIFKYRRWYSTPAQDEANVNLFVVPKSERGAALGLMHIIDDCRIQVGCVTWEHLENTSFTHHIEAAMFRDSTLIYSANDESRHRYEELKSRITGNNATQITPEAIFAAEKHLQHAKDCFADFCVDDNVLNAARILDTLCDCMCKLNDAHPRFGASNIVDELKTFPRLPDGFIDTFSEIMYANTDIERAKNLCKTLMSISIKYVNEQKHSLFRVLPGEFLPGWYEMFLDSWDSMLTHHENGDKMAVYLTAMQLQHWLTIIEDNQGKPLPNELQLFHKFDATKMDEFINHAQQSKQAFLNLLGEHNVPITKINSMDELRSVLTSM